jgi:hypothetical protein
MEPDMHKTLIQFNKESVRAIQLALREGRPIGPIRGVAGASLAAGVLLDHAIAEQCRAQCQHHDDGSEPIPDDGGSEPIPDDDGSEPIPDDVIRYFFSKFGLEAIRVHAELAGLVRTGSYDATCEPSVTVLIEPHHEPIAVRGVRGKLPEIFPPPAWLTPYLVEREEQEQRDAEARRREAEEN